MCIRDRYKALEDWQIDVDVVDGSIFKDQTADQYEVLVLAANDWLRAPVPEKRHCARHQNEVFPSLCPAHRVILFLKNYMKTGLQNRFLMHF